MQNSDATYQHKTSQPVYIILYVHDTIYTVTYNKYSHNILTNIVSMWDARFGSHH